MTSMFDRLSYVARQGARVAWFMGHYVASQDFRDTGQGGEQRPAPPAARRNGAVGGLVGESRPRGRDPHLQRSWLCAGW